MALNPSGPISLAGSVTGQSIAVELSQAPFSVISLNDTNVRTLAGVPTGAITMPTDFWGKSNTPPAFWVYIDPASGATFWACNYNTYNNKFYVAVVQTSPSNTWLSELNMDGTVNWVRLVTFSDAGRLSNGNAFSTHVSFDTSNNIYAQIITTVGGQSRPGVAKFDSSGNFISASRWNSAAGTGSPGGTAFWNNNFVYTQINSAPPLISAARYLARTPDTNALTFSALLANPVNTGQTPVVVQKKYSNNNLLIYMGTTPAPGGSPQERPGVALLDDSTFTITAGKTVPSGPTGFNNNNYGFAQNQTNGDIYVLYRANSGHATIPSLPLLIKFDQNFNEIWSYSYNVGSALITTSTSLFYDNSENVLYFSAPINDPADIRNLIIKINPTTGDVISTIKMETFNSGARALGTLIFPIQIAKKTNIGQYIVTLSPNNSVIITPSLSIFNSGTITSPVTPTISYTFASTTNPVKTSFSAASSPIGSAPYSTAYTRATVTSVTNTPATAKTIKTNV